MSMESTVKFHFAKTQNFSGMAPTTSPDTLTGTDYIAAMGFAMSNAPLGYHAFMGKVGISENDAQNAVSLLTEYALENCDKVAALRKLDADVKPLVMQRLAIYAYMEYCQSASTKKPCQCCEATGFIEVEKFTMKSAFGVVRPEQVTAITRLESRLGCNVGREVREVVKVLCHECKGKGVVSSACLDCKGRGKAADRKETLKQGIPVIGECKRCVGRGFERIPSTEAFRAIEELDTGISLATWEKSVKKFYDGLISKIEIEESWANSSLVKATM